MTRYLTDVLPASQYASLARKRPKYRNVTVRCDGYTFDSKAEHKRYEELVLLERAGEISQLGVHPLFKLGTCGHVLGNYEADFTYRDRSGAVKVEDVKGVRTALYRWKAKHMKAQYGIDVIELPA